MIIHKISSTYHCQVGTREVQLLQNMSYIFLDESGDLGFDFTKNRTSKYFVITCLFTEEKRLIEKLVSKTHASLRKIHKKRSGVLHAHEETSTTRLRLLRNLAL